MERVIPTEYPDYPARAPLEFEGEEYRSDYKRESDLTPGKIIDFGDVLRQRAKYLGDNLDLANKMLLGQVEGGADFRFIENVVADLIRVERIEKMLNYQKFFDFVFLLHQQKQQLDELAPTLPTSDKFKVKRIVNNIPVLTSHLRVTPMGPEPNQVNNMCKTQYWQSVDPKTGMMKKTSQKDQCTTVYDMCRGKQDEFGVIDHTRDLLCTRYIKKQVFPKESQFDPDVAKHFRNYNYARDGADYLKGYVTQHDWQEEYKLGGKLNQWDTTYTTTGSKGPLRYADGTEVSTFGRYSDRGVRESEDQNAFAKMIAGRPQQASSYITASQAAYEKRAAQEKAIADNEARRKALQNEQLKQGILNPILSPVKSPVSSRTKEEIIAGFGPEAVRFGGMQLQPGQKMPLLPQRRLTPRKVPGKLAANIFPGSR